MPLLADVAILNTYHYNEEEDEKCKTFAMIKN